MLLSEKECRHVCEKLLSMTRAEDAHVSVTGGDSSHLRFAANGFTTSGRVENTSARITLWIGQKSGSASAANLEPASLEEAVRQAELLASISPVDKEYMPTLGPQKYRPTAGYADATADISPEDRARRVHDIITDCQKHSLIGAGFHQSSASASAFATKHGLFHYQRSTLVSLSATARTEDGKSSGYFLRNHFDVRKLETARIGREAIQKALTSREPRVLEAGTYPVILEAQAANDLLQHIQFNARSTDEGRSAYSGPNGTSRVGEKIFDERLNIYSDPWHPELPDSSSAQDGLPAEKIYFVRNGVLEQLSYSRYWAHEKNKQPTPGPVNMILETNGSKAKLEEMIAGMNRGLLISRFWYIRGVDPRTALFTGLTRDGVWYVEKGKIQYPVRNFRFNQSILELLAPGNVEMIGASERVSASESQGEGSALMPAISVKRFHLTSQSEAV